MSTKHTFTHPDGTVSKRTSANRVYPFAVECVRNDHGYAKSLESYDLGKAEERLASFEAAVDADQWTTDTKVYGSFTSHSLILEGYGYVAGWYTNHTVNGEPRPDKDDPEPDRVAALATQRERLTADIARITANIRALFAGPEFSYSIITWSSRRDLAAKEASRMNGRSAWYCQYRVVETTHN